MLSTPSTTQGRIQLRMRSVVGGMVVALCSVGAHASDYPRMVFIQEPAVTPDVAKQVVGQAQVLGRLVQQQAAYIKWRVAETDQPDYWQFDLGVEPKQSVRVVITPKSEQSQQVSMSMNDFGAATTVVEPIHTFTLDDGALTQQLEQLVAGEYVISIETQKSDAEFQLQLLGSAETVRDESILRGESLSVVQTLDDFEPNDSRQQAALFAFGTDVSGTFHSDADNDYFQFALAGESRVTFTLTPPETAQVEAKLYWQDTNQVLRFSTADAIQVSDRIPMGDYTLALASDLASGTPYQLQGRLAPSWSLFGETVPAQQKQLAPYFPHDGVVRATMGGMPKQEGWYRLPVGEERTIRWQGHVSTSGYAYYTGLRFEDELGHPLQVQRPSDTEGMVTIPAQQQAFVYLSYGGNTSTVQVDDPLAVKPTRQYFAELTTESDVFSALSPFEQRLPLTLTWQNISAHKQKVSLLSEVSHQGVYLEGLQQSFELSPHERHTQSLTLVIPPLQPASQPLHVFIGEPEQGETAALELPLTFEAPDPSVRALADENYSSTWVNLAWHALGSRFIDEAAETKWHSLHDNHIGFTGVRSNLKQGEQSPVLSLAGDNSVIEAIVFETRSDIDPAYLWKSVEVLAGTAPDQLEVVLTADLSLRAGQQLFRLEQPTVANYVAFRPLSLWAERWLSSHGMGEIKVLGELHGGLAIQKHDILSHELGGHWLYTLPDHKTLHGLFGNGRGYDAQALNQHRLKQGMVSQGRHFEMVFAFRDHQQAALAALQWHEDLTWHGEPLTQVELHVANESPLGPWHAVGNWALERDAEGVAEWQFDAPVLARYIKLGLPEPLLKEDGTAVTWRLPKAIQAYESGSLQAGTSVLNFQQPSFDVQIDLAKSATETVHSYQFNQPGERESLTLQVPDGSNSLTVTLDESHRGRLFTQLTSAQGEAFALDWQPLGQQRQAVIRGLTPGDYQLTLEEPPRSIVFLWDGSDSVAHHQVTLYQALQEFSAGVAKGREIVNLLPIGGPLLIDGWAESGEQLRQAVASYDGRYSSSEVEQSLQLAVNSLANQVGEKVVFILTDGAQSARYMPLWQQLKEDAPRLFTVQLPTSNYAFDASKKWYQQQMKMWAAVNNGRYYQARSRSELQQALQLGMRELRGGTRASVHYESSFEEPLQPGALEVVSGAEALLAGGAVQIIFDASGSMLQRMDGGRRIEVARQVLEQVLQQRIPEDFPVGLRVFGHTEPDSCETELLVAPDVSSRAQVITSVRRIQAVNLARTPLAASIAGLANDLDGRVGRQLVIVLTDGEETCGGDIEAALQQLKGKNFNVQLNIVGFHIEDETIADEFRRLAALTQGSYFSSVASGELAQALTDALSPQWRLENSNGEVVAQGRVGDPALDVVAGDYRLIVESHRGTLTQQVAIHPEELHTVEVNHAEY